MLYKVKNSVAVSKMGEDLLVLELLAISNGVNMRWETRSVPVTPFVVVPRDKFHKGLAQSNPSIGVKDTGPVLTKLKSPHWSTTKKDFDGFEEKKRDQP